MDKIRLDIYLFNKQLVPSRSKAAQLITSGHVLVNNKTILKPSYEVNEIDDIKIIANEVLKYVSRGGLKLEKALDFFNVDVNGLITCDIGASTGGFTDCLLKHGAKKVYAIDVGTRQLDESLLNNHQVISYENTNFKEVSKSLFAEDIDLFVCDVSFISIKIILEKLKQIQDDFTIIILYKPQFEVGKNNLNHKGVVKNNKILEKSLNEFKEYLKSQDIGLLKATFSPIKGQKEGNIEFLFYLKNKIKGQDLDLNLIIKEANKVLEA